MRDVAALTPKPSVEQYAGGLRIILLVVAAFVQFALSSRALATWLPHYRPAWVAVTAFVVIAAVTLGSGWWVLRLRPLPPAFTVVGTVAIFVASSGGSLAVPRDRFFEDAHWTFGLAGWPLLLLLTTCTLPTVAVALGANAAINLVLYVLIAPFTAAAFAAAGTAVSSVLGFQLAVAIAVHFSRVRAAMAAELAVQRAGLITDKLIAEDLERRNRSRRADQLGGALPLLVGLADQTLDVEAEQSRQLCALGAARLRRLLAEGDSVSDSLGHELAACVDVAQRNGLVVELRISGPAQAVPVEVRRALTEPVMTALAMAVNTAHVTLLRTAGTTRVAIVAGTSREHLTIPHSTGIEMTSSTEDGTLWVEALWRRQPND
ncbi:hypothetical protein [Actinosynnema sp. NPDC023587]|uniref:hypothetical protein n=1 Tax=Actinosynnema sp. NPDC023587 TaxID=3154695 RepID=UPI0033C0B4F9